MTGAVVSLRSASGSEAVAAASDPASTAAAELELSLGEGPSRDAFRLGRPVLVADLDDGREESWVGYTSAAADLGVGSVFAFPLHLGAARFGVLTHVRRLPRNASDRLRTARCLALSDLATETLLVGSDARTDGRLDPDLESALDFRSEIYQAQGMVMVTLGTDLSDASGADARPRLPHRADAAGGVRRHSRRAPGAPRRGSRAMMVLSTTDAKEALR